MKQLIILAIAAGLLSACVEADTKDAKNKEWVERSYRTGSNIPSKHTAGEDGVTSVSKDDMDRMRNGSSGAIPSMPSAPPGGAH
ncbi:MAG TPA: hypothetical protein VKR38_17745 [Usitatibacter sp.]|nr:hypothetical protein [Usitatibacter sp.]